MLIKKGDVKITHIIKSEDLIDDEFDIEQIDKKAKSKDKISKDKTSIIKEKSKG